MERRGTIMEWVVFYINGSEVHRMSVEGSFAGEVVATAELLAYEHDVHVSKVTCEIEGGTVK